MNIIFVPLAGQRRIVEGVVGVVGRVGGGDAGEGGGRQLRGALRGRRHCSGGA